VSSLSADVFCTDTFRLIGSFHSHMDTLMSEQRQGSHMVGVRFKAIMGFFLGGFPVFLHLLEL
jgi:hypothetical protein